MAERRNTRAPRAAQRAAEIVPADPDKQARELIDQFGNALRALAEGKAVPAKWRAWIDAALGPARKRGTSPNTYVQQRNARWADAMLEADLARESGGESGGERRSRSQVAAALAGALSAADVFKAEARGGREQAIARKVTAKLALRDETRKAKRRRQAEESRGTPAAGIQRKRRK